MTMPYVVRTSVFRLTIGRGLGEVSNAAREEFRIHDFTAPPIESQFPFQLISLKGKQLSNISLAKGDLTTLRSRLCCRR